MLKRLTVLAILVCLFGAVTTGAAQDKAAADRSPLSVDANVALNSAYMFRGQNLYDGASIQPYLGVSYDTGNGVISATNWMHISADGRTNVPEFFEMDWGLSYELSLEPATITIGNLWYTYPNDNDDIDNTAEMYISAAFDDSSFNSFYTVNPKLTVSKDWDALDYYYYELILNHPYEGGSIPEGMTLTPYVTFGLSSNSEKVYAKDGLEQISEGVALDIPVGSLTLTPTANYTHKIDDLTANQFWFGMTLAGTL